MQIRISDLMTDCCPTDVTIGTPDKARARRINALVMDKLQVSPTRNRRRKFTTSFLLAAVLVMLLGTVAFAATDYCMNVDRPDEDGALIGRVLKVDQDGQVLTDVKQVFADAGLVLSFSGPEATDEAAMCPEFRCFYLPSEPTFGVTDEEGWTHYLTDDTGDLPYDIPYVISASCVEPGVGRLVVTGDVSVLMNETMNGWQVLEIHSDYSPVHSPTYDSANYIVMFDQSRGYQVTVCGTLDMAELEKIAKGMEIRESDQPYVSSGYQEDIGILAVGRG